MADSVWTLTNPRGMTGNVLDATVDTVVRWLDIGRDVVIHADTGGGRTTTLRKVSAALSEAGVASVLVDHSLLRQQRSGATAVRPGVSRGQESRGSVVQRISEVVDDLGTAGVLLVDDVQELSDQEFEVIEQLLNRTSAIAVLTTSRPYSEPNRPSTANRLLAERGPALVDVQPLNYETMALLVTEYLGGPVDAALVSALTAWSAGNPAVARAVLDAARFASLIDVRSGVWMLIDDLNRAPMEPVSYLLLSELDPADIEALEVLSLKGLSTMGEMRSLVPDPVLYRLIERYRIVVHRWEADPGEHLVAVSPPALSCALRARMRKTRWIKIAGVAGPGTSDLDTRLAGDGGGLQALLSEAPSRFEDSDERRTAQLTGLVHERAAMDETVARVAWEQNPTVATAVAYVAKLLRRPYSEVTQTVFAQTRERNDDDPEIAAMFRYLRDRWPVSQHESNRNTLVIPKSGEWLAGPEGQPDPVEVVQQAAKEGWNDVELETRLDLPTPAGSEPESALTRLRAAGALLAAGRLDLLLGMTESTALTRKWMPTVFSYYLAGVRDLALMLSDRIPESEAQSRARLEDAYERLDLAGVRVHSVAFVQALWAGGKRSEAWRVLNTALRLGPPGPYGTTFYRRTLMMGASLAAQSENMDLAHLLLKQLRDTPGGYNSIIATMPAIAEAHILRAEGNGSEADELLWRNGEQSLEAGWPALALEYWVSRQGPSTPEQIEAMQELLRRSPVPLYARMVELHAALASGDATVLDSALRAAPVEIVPDLAATAVVELSDVRVRSGATPLSMSEVVELVGPTTARRLHRETALSAAVAQLSERELEIAQLLTSGQTNKEIAQSLHLSQRTVENHVYRAMRKLGTADRRDLVGMRLVN